ncbi:MAG: SDR family NAD(P)-dependent oxidoreductase, partial [Deltaproteobacteria bacterium]|nr:SDR family NAD(P)-dependent oxidoreductase [Deltaproteobacteria bacterium]
MAERVLIFGATSAIAQEIAHVYARRGARLYLVGRSQEKLTALVAALAGAAAAARNPVVGTDTADLNETARSATLIATGIAALGGVDVALIAHGLLGDQQATEH